MEEEEASKKIEEILEEEKNKKIRLPSVPFILTTSKMIAKTKDQGATREAIEGLLKGIKEGYAKRAEKRLQKRLDEVNTSLVPQKKKKKKYDEEDSDDE